MAGLYDDAGIVVDPVTGQIISAPQTNAPGGGVGGALSGLRGALFPPGPAAAMPAPPQAPMAPAGPPQGPPPVPPDAHDQLSAIGIPPSGQPAPGAVQGAQEGLPPGAAQVNAGALPVPPVPPPQAPDAPYLQPGATPPGYLTPQIGSTDVAQPQPPSLATPQGTSTGRGQDYSQAAPPPDPLKPIVDAAASKYGVPSQVAYWMGSHESGWDPKAVGMQTSSGKAMGAWQFMPATAKQYGLSDPTDFAASTDAAMHYISDLAKKNGGDWAAAIKQYGTFSTGMGKDRDAAAEAGFRTYMGQSAPADTVSLASTSTPVQAAPQDALQADLQRPLNTSLPYPNAARPQAGNGLLALASGLLSGPTYGAGMGKGLQAYLGQQQQDRQAQMGANNEFMQMQRLGLDNDYKRIMAGNAVTKTGIQAAPKPFGQPTIVKDDQGNEQVMQPMRDGAGNVTNVPLPGMTPAGMRAAQGAQRLTIAQQALNLKNDPTQLARLTAEKVAATSAQKDQDAVYASQSQDQQGLQDINEAQSLIAQKPELMGPTLANRWARFSAEIGLSGQAADLNALQKMTADQRNTFLSTLTNGHVGGIRSNAELKNLSQAVADVNTSPAAANYILNMQKSQLQAKDAWRSELTARSQTDPDSLTGRQYNVTKNQFFDDYWKQHPLQSYQSPSGTSSPAPSAASGASPSGTAPGVSRVLRYDTKGNLVQ